MKDSLNASKGEQSNYDIELKHLS